MPKEGYAFSSMCMSILFPRSSLTTDWQMGYQMMRVDPAVAYVTKVFNQCLLLMTYGAETSTLQ